MTHDIDAREVEMIAEGLTAAQRGICVESEPGAWGRDDDGTGSELCGAGEWSAARALVRKGLGEIEMHPGMWPPGLFFNNTLGLAVRQHLQDRRS